MRTTIHCRLSANHALRPENETWNMVLRPNYREDRASRERAMHGNGGQHLSITACENQGESALTSSCRCRGDQPEKYNWLALSL